MYDLHSKRPGIAAAVITSAFAWGMASASTFTVNRTGDTTGACTASACNIRQAIDAANATTKMNTIVFNIPACGTKTILITGESLHISNPVKIDATTQPTCGSTPADDPVSRIELRGQGVNVRVNNHVVHGLVLDAGSDGSEIRGFSLNNFSGDGIGVNSSHNWIHENKAGTDPTGNIATRPNNFGIVVGNSGSDNLIEANVISANSRDGLDILGDGNQVFANLIGTKSDGVTAMGNGGIGVSIFSAIDTLIGSVSLPNVIAFNGAIPDPTSGAFSPGIEIGQGNFNEILGNSIHDNKTLGIKLDGTAANGGQVAPAITSITSSSRLVGMPPHVQFTETVKGTLANVNGSSAFKVDIYGNDGTCDGSSAAEGAAYLATSSVASNGTFSVSIPFVLGGTITALARSPDGNTSQFSNCFATP